jgi:hypothetical protein
MILPAHIRPATYSILESARKHFEKHADIHALGGPVLAHHLSGKAAQAYRHLRQHPLYSGPLRPHVAGLPDLEHCPLLQAEFICLRSTAPLEFSRLLTLPAQTQLEELTQQLQNTQLSGHLLGALGARALEQKNWLDCLWQETAISYLTINKIRRRLPDPQRSERSTHFLIALLVTLAWLSASLADGLVRFWMILALVTYVGASITLGMINRDGEGPALLWASILTPFAIVVSGLITLSGLFDFIFHPILPGQKLDAPDQHSI